MVVELENQVREAYICYHLGEKIRRRNSEKDAILSCLVGLNPTALILKGFHHRPMNGKNFSREERESLHIAYIRDRHRCFEKEPSRFSYSKNG